MLDRQGVRIGVVGIILLLPVLALAGSCQKKPADESATASSPDTVQQARLAAGQTIYLANCAMCHGEWGQGDGPLTPQLQKQANVVPAHLNNRARLDSLGRAGLIRVIEEGGAHTGRSNLMPAWSERLSREEIDGVADFVMALPELHPEIPPATLARFLQAPPGASAEGHKLYVTLCTACHGSAGKGDGEFVDTLLVRSGVRPRDLTDSLYFATKADRDLFATVSLGGGFFHKSAYMPIWGVTLSPEQIQHLVSYVRTLSRTAPRR